MLIFDSNNIIDLIKIRSSINELEDKKEFYTNEIDTLRKEEKALFSNIKNLEKFAREKYLMKKDNEDIFVIIE
jgi:cell division protein FtsB